MSKGSKEGEKRGISEKEKGRGWVGWGGKRVTMFSVSASCVGAALPRVASPPRSVSPVHADEPRVRSCPFTC